MLTPMQHPAPGRTVSFEDDMTMSNTLERDDAYEDPKPDGDDRGVRHRDRDPHDRGIQERRLPEAAGTRHGTGPVAGA